MRKWILVSFCVLAAIVLSIELLIPSTLEILRTEPVRCKAAAAFPFLSEERRWTSWWTDSVQRARFHIEKLSYLAVDIGIRQDEQVLNSRLVLLPLGNADSSILHWETRISSGWSPVDRIRQYRRAVRLKGVMDSVLAQAGEFLGKSENVYGVKISEGSTRDTMLIATNSIKTSLPTNEDIYVELGRLRRYIAETHSGEVGYPMVHFSPKDTQKGTYRLMVAIPIDRKLEPRGDIEFMHLVPGRFLITEVTGGPFTVGRAFSGLEDYIRDHQRTVMAVPFQVLVTDRKKTEDSARWVTRVYYPVM